MSGGETKDMYIKQDSEEHRKPIGLPMVATKQYFLCFWIASMFWLIWPIDLDHLFHVQQRPRPSRITLFQHVLPHPHLFPSGSKKIQDGTRADRKSLVVLLTWARCLLYFFNIGYHWLSLNWILHVPQANVAAPICYLWFGCNSSGLGQTWKGQIILKTTDFDSNGNFFFIKRNPTPSLIEPKEDILLRRSLPQSSSILWLTNSFLDS